MQAPEQVALVVPVLAIIGFAAEARRPRKPPAITHPGTLFCRIADVAFSHIYALNWMSVGGRSDRQFSLSSSGEHAERRIGTADRPCKSGYNFHTDYRL